MFWTFPWSKSVDNDAMVDLEGLLNAHMIPIQPSARFVSELGRRLTIPPSSAPEITEPWGWRSALLTTAGLLSGTFLLVVVIRGIGVLSKYLGKARKVKNHSHKFSRFSSLG